MSNKSGNRELERRQQAGEYHYPREVAFLPAQPYNR